MKTFSPKMIALGLAFAAACKLNAAESSIVLEKLTFHSPEEDGRGSIMLNEELVWDVGGDEAAIYQGAQLIEGVRKDDVLLALLQLDREKSKLKMIYLKGAMNIYPREAGKHEYMLKAFVRNGGEWNHHLSVFTNSIWGDVLGEKIEELIVDGVNAYGLRYRGSWKILEEKSPLIPIMDKIWRYPGEEEFTVKVLNFDETHNLLFAIEDGKSEYIDKAVWWSAFDDFEWGKVSQVRYADLKSKRMQQCELLGIEPKEYVLIPKTKPPKPPKLPSVE